jgi:hypothetical protein
MKKLFSYCIPGDDGAAPNPYWNICTLNICKPVIRRTAKKGDWIVGTGSKRYGFENKVVYAMEVTKTLTMQEYEQYCKTQLPQKIPIWKSKSYKKRVGDCIYDFSTNPPTILDSVHTNDNIKTDLGGKNTLLSNHFYYFGDKPEPLPDFLIEIVKQGQGHKSNSNQPFFHLFVDWITSKTKAKNKLLSHPKSMSEFFDQDDCRSVCSKRDKFNDEQDEQLGDN